MSDDRLQQPSLHHRVSPTVDPNGELILKVTDEGQVSMETEMEEDKDEGRDDEGAQGEDEVEEGMQQKVVGILGDVLGFLGEPSATFWRSLWNSFGHFRYLLQTFLGQLGAPEASHRPPKGPWETIWGHLGSILEACLLYTSPSPRDRG